MELMISTGRVSSVVSTSYVIIAIRKCVFRRGDYINFKVPNLVLCKSIEYGSGILDEAVSVEDVGSGQVLVIPPASRGNRCWLTTPEWLGSATTQDRARGQTTHQCVHCELYSIQQLEDEHYIVMVCYWQNDMHQVCARERNASAEREEQGSMRGLRQVTTIAAGGRLCPVLPSR